MATTSTTNLALIKPTQNTNEPASIFTSHNPNMDKLDAHDHGATLGAPIKRVQSGTFAARPAAGNAGHVYVATDTAVMFFDTGAAWVEIQAGSIVTADLASNAVNVLQLNYTAAVDLANVSAIAANTWTDLGTNQSFTVVDATSLVSIEVGGCTLGVSPVSAASIAARIVIDSAGTPINVLFAGGTSQTSQYAPFFAGAKPIKVTGLAAGSHTVKVQLYTTIAGTVLCRAATSPNTESLLISVVESKR
ncbi:MAG TPA: hypothetical protein VNM48_08615 [Chloroflexota bacterium]|nr:hypothetical protein [Chloroflexota bacterium]